MNIRNANRSIIFLALAASLSACGGGGGGGGVKSDPPPPPSNPPPTQPPPPPPVCEDADAVNVGGALPCAYRYNGRADNQLVPVNVDLVHKQGLKGEGVKVGVLDTTFIADYPTVDAGMAWKQNYLSESDGISTNKGHGNVVAATLAGRPGDPFKGGVAPAADIYYAEVCGIRGCEPTLASKAIADMAAQGVRVFNASYGGGGGDALNESDALANARFYTGVIDNDALLVSSAGNTSKPNPGGMAGMPAVDARYIGHTIVAAAGALDEKGKVTGLADYSTACGFAANWCITAPGLIGTPAVTGGFYPNGAQGTSIAAPIVTGAAALVWQAFPWMSAPNVQQTILTTATDLGEPGVDAIYGWGLLDASKAVRGPALFQGSDFAADFDAGTFTFANDIAGDAGLIKDGMGSLILSGSSTYTGTTSVQGGELIAMSGLGGSVAVRTGATLTAGGKIAGDFTADEGATTAIAIGNKLIIGGAASLAGDVRLLAAADGYQIGATETLLTAGSLTGTFEDVLYGSNFFYNATLSYEDNEVTATLARVNVQAAALQSMSVGRVVEGAKQADALFQHIDANPDGERTALVASAGQLASAQSVEAAQLSLSSLTGEVHGTSRAAAISMAVSDTAVFGDRIATLSASDTGTWVQTTRMDAEFEREGFSAADVHQQSLSVGVDRSVGTGIIGAALSSGRGWGELDVFGGRFDSDHSGVSIYGRSALPVGYLAGSLGYTRHDVDTNRALLLGDTVVPAFGQRKDDVWAVRIEAGAKFGAVTPFLAGGYVRHEQGAVTESGDALALSIQSQNAAVHFGEVGVRFDHTVNRLSLRGSVSGRWTSGDTRPVVLAQFVGAPGVDVEIHGQRVPANAIRAAAGFDYRATRNLLLNLGLTAETGAGDSSNIGASGGLRLTF